MLKRTQLEFTPTKKEQNQNSKKYFFLQKLSKAEMIESGKMVDQKQKNKNKIIFLTFQTKNKNNKYVGFLNDSAKKFAKYVAKTDKNVQKLIYWKHIFSEQFDKTVI